MRLAAAAALRLGASFACARSRGTPEPARGRVVIETAGGARLPVQVELARTEAERERGLMWRTTLAPDAGMLFLFDGSDRHVFWMKNTPLPLDMIFIDDDGRIVGIVERAEPETTSARDPGVDSRYVLEVNGGWAAAHGVARGDRVRFEDVARF